MGIYDRPYNPPSFAGVTDQRLRALQLQQAQLAEYAESLAEAIENDESFGELKSSLICVANGMANLTNQVGDIINGLQDANLSKPDR